MSSPDQSSHEQSPSRLNQNSNQHESPFIEERAEQPPNPNPDITSATRSMNNNNQPANSSSFMFAYRLDPITNQLVRTQVSPQQGEQLSPPGGSVHPLCAGIAIQARTNVTVHTADDSDGPSSPSTQAGAGAGQAEGQGQELPRELFDSIMNTISAMMGVVPNPTTNRGPNTNLETPIDAEPDMGVSNGTDMGVSNDIRDTGVTFNTSTSAPALHTSTPGSQSSAPIPDPTSSSSNSTSTGSNATIGRTRTIGVEDIEENEYADMPSLMDPSPDSSLDNTPRQAGNSLSAGQPQTHRRNENSNIMQTLMEAAAVERERRQNDYLAPFADTFGNLPSDSTNAQPNPIPPPATMPTNNENGDTSGNPNPNPIRFTRLNASDLPGAWGGGEGGNIFGFPAALMGGLMGLGGAGMGLPLSMLNAERPPDTRRAKELLKGLTVVPHGLVRRLERVEALKDKMLKEKMRTRGDVVESVTKGEGNAIGEGRLLCPVCYDPLLPDTDSKPEEEDMEVDEDEDEMDTKQDSDSQVDPALPTSTPTPEKAEKEKEKESKQKSKRVYPYQQPNALIALPCTHIFHSSSCLQPWFETGKTTCPTCRFDVDPRSETLDLSWLQGAGRRRANANGNTTGNQATPHLAGPTQTEATPSTTAGANDDNPNPNPNANPDPNANAAGNGEANNAGAGANFREVFTNVLRNAIAQAMATALNSPSPPPPGGQPATEGPQASNLGPQYQPQPPGLQTQGLSPGLQTQGLSPGLLTPGSQSGSREGTRPPPSPQALAFQRAFDAQQQETALQSQPVNDSEPPALANDSDANPPRDGAVTNPESSPPADGMPQPNYDVLVRDIVVADQGDGQMDVFMREMLMPPNILQGFDWSDMTPGPGPSTSPLGSATADATGTLGESRDDENASPEDANAAMEGVENTNTTPSTSGTLPSRYPGLGLGLGTGGSMRTPLTTRRAAHLTPDGTYVPAAQRTSSGSGSAGLSHSSLPSPHALFTIDVIFILGPNSNTSNSIRQPSTSSEPSSASQDTASGSTLSPPTPSPSRPRTPSSAARHHPYASPRSSNLNPASLASARGIGSDEPNPNPSTPGNPLGDNTAQANGNGNQDNISFSRHSITFSFSFGRGPNASPNPNLATPANETQDQNGPRPDQMPFTPEGFVMGGDIIFGMGPAPFGFAAGGLGGGVPRAPRANRPKKKWVAPEGTSLRSVVESKEREVGLRCDDVSCLWGPEDDDDLSSEELKIREARVWLKKRGSDGLLEPSCAHRFHPECILVASRVADQHLDEEITQEGGDDAQLIEAACPFCRARGALRREEWRDAKERAENV